MKPKRWISFFTLTVAVVMSVIITVNYIVNPYNVFQPNSSTFNYVKKFIIADRMTLFYEMNHIQPQTLLVGSSRIGYFKSDTYGKYVPKPTFNLSLAGSSIYEQEEYIQYAIRHNKLKTLIWSLDFYAFNPDITPAFPFDPDRLRTSFYLHDYFISLISYRTFERSIKTIKLNRKMTPSRQKQYGNMIESASYIDVQGQTLDKAAIKRNINATLNEYRSLTAFLRSQRFTDPVSVETGINRVKKILDLCRQNDISVYIYLSPAYYKHIDMIYDMQLGNTFEYWKKRLASITDYIDFCTYNSITMDIMRFRDSSHTVNTTGHFIFAKLFKDKNVTVPKDFGTYVTAGTVDSHLRKQRKLVHEFSLEKK